MNRTQIEDRISALEELADEFDRLGFYGYAESARQLVSEIDVLDGIWPEIFECAKCGWIDRIEKSWYSDLCDASQPLCQICYQKETKI